MVGNREFCFETDSTKEVALMLFTRNAAEEAEVKAFSGQNHAKSSRAIGSLLIERARKIAAKSGLPLFVISSSDQVGDSFGERYSNAFKSIYEKGYAKVLSIGNDCLDLDSQDLIAAAGMLKNCEAVIGPSGSGGAYLIGLDISVFKEDAFLDLPWNSDRLFDKIKLEFESAALKILSQKNDINSHQDLLRELNLMPDGNAVKEKILSILYRKPKVMEAVIADYHFQIFRHSVSRAPPLFC